MSYLQYPFLLLSAYYSLVTGFDLGQSLAKKLEIDLTNINMTLVFMGLAISLASLQDTTKVQFSFAKKIYQNRAKANFFFVVVAVEIFIFLGLGVAGMFSSVRLLHEISFGLISLGVGLIGLLKAAVEMFEHQQKLLTHPTDEFATMP